MQKESPTKVTEKIWTTKNPYLRGAPTRWPMPEQLQSLPTAALHGTPTEALKVKQASESAAKNESNF